ncbi:hypothetical protein [Arthrobacter woluwensis]|uniref:TrbL/VirB6 plasmid conjugal transfer protein n=1 Tax=Arthrobacter woluwensis TaxID=156980 RepID=A0A1H4IA32_9MICC|nr:hypothetical protein [Arthrobacter woluwensis]SEB30132.1 hypothetical protein SAMN04489745_0112 [Arthrobacter woluwensis]
MPVIVKADWAGDLQNFLGGGIKAFASGAWENIQASFSSTDMSPSWWVSVVGGTINTHVGGNVTTTHYPGMLPALVEIMAPVAVALAAVQVMLSAYRQSTKGMIRAGVMAIFAVPGTYVAAGFFYVLITLCDNLAMGVLHLGSAKGESDAYNALMGLFGISWDPNTHQAVLDENYQQWAMAKDTGNPGAVILPVGLAVLVWVLTFALAAFLVFRLLALMILASMLPIAVMTQPLDGAKAIGAGFGKVSGALMLSKILAALVLKMAFLISTAATSMWQFAAGCVAILIAALMPVLSVKFASFFLGGHGDGLIGGAENLGRSAGRQASRFGSSGFRSTTRTLGRVGRGLR